MKKKKFALVWIAWTMLLCKTTFAASPTPDSARLVSVPRYQLQRLTALAALGSLDAQQSNLLKAQVSLGQQRFAAAADSLYKARTELRAAALREQDYVSRLNRNGAYFIFLITAAAAYLAWRSGLFRLVRNLLPF